MGTNKFLGDNLTKCWEVTCDGLVSHPGGVEILLVASYCRNRLMSLPGSPNYYWDTLYVNKVTIMKSSRKTVVFDGSV